MAFVTVIVMRVYLCYPRQMLLYSQEVGEDCTSNEEDLFIL